MENMQCADEDSATVHYEIKRPTGEPRPRERGLLAGLFYESAIQSKWGWLPGRSHHKKGDYTLGV